MIKQFFDICVSIVFLILFSPILVCVALLICIFDGRPIIFQQPRVGYKNKIIKIYKFRTMRVQTALNDSLLDKQKSITKLGKFLRKTSLDELPQLFNVLKGDLSLVGPRPLITDYLSLYSTFQVRRHECKPGITGWAQVKGRNQLTWEEKFKLDVWYVDNQNLWLDMKILWLTFFKVISSKNIGNGDQLIMPKFTGNIDKEQKNQ